MPDIVMTTSMRVPFLVLPITYLASGNMPDVQSEYPLCRRSFSSATTWSSGNEMAYIIIYYIAWEFFFRGFLLFPLAKRFGGMNAVLIQTISSCLVQRKTRG